MRELQLISGETAYVDDQDYPRVCMKSWHCSYRGSRPYVYTFDRREPIKLARFILHSPAGYVTYVDSNPLNCTRANLRVVRPSESRLAARGKSGTSSRYKGVSWVNRDSHWRAHIGSRIIGAFKSEEEAARARDRAALEMFGPGTYLNFPEDVCHG